MAKRDMSPTTAWTTPATRRAQDPQQPGPFGRSFTPELISAPVKEDAKRAVFTQSRETGKKSLGERLPRDRSPDSRQTY